MSVYNSTNLKIQLGAHTLADFMDGEAIRFIPDDSGDVQKIQGIGGATALSVTPYDTGRFEVDLKLTSDSNKFLSAARIGLQQAQSIGFFPVLLKDYNGNTLITCETAWVMSFPKNITYGTTITGRTWVIDCEVVNMFITGTPNPNA